MGIFSTRRRVARTRSGRYELNLPSHERALVVNLVDQLRDVLAASTDDPSVRRLFPTAYAQDAERDREYQQLVRDELLERRLSALATVEETAEATEVGEEKLDPGLTAINDNRQVPRTILAAPEAVLVVREDDPEPTNYPGHPKT